MEPAHGGDWTGFFEQYRSLPLDFSANISPLGLPESVRQAVIRSLSEADCYPDPKCRALSRALAQKYRLAQCNVLCGNGASDLIYRLALAKRPKNAMVTAPTFSEYQNALERVSCQVQHFTLFHEQGFTVTEDILKQITPGLDLLILCEPNNPTGITTPMPLLRAILKRCAECDVLLVIDECFNALLDHPEEHTLADQLYDYNNLLILSAFTKGYAMAGLRLGFALSRNCPLLEAMQQAGPPWSVSHVAQAAGTAALEEADYLPQLRDLLKRERPRLKLALEQLGCKVTDGEANYLFFYHHDTNLCIKMREKGVLIRDCRDYNGLTPGYYRIAVRTQEENTRLISVMKEVLCDG